MNKSDLKNGMFFEMRNKSKFLILNNEIYLEDIYRYEYSNKLHYFLESYNDDMCSINDNKYDIMKVFNSCNELLWEREEIDWTKVSVDTKVLVRDSKDEEWQRKHFAKYVNGKVFTYDYGTSWDTSLMTTWKYAKLAEEPKEEIIVSAKDLYKTFRTMCESHPCCDCCDYNYSVGTCEFKWISDNYNVIRKE